jgi:hypothetical protein
MTFSTIYSDNLFFFISLPIWSIGLISQFHWSIFLQMAGLLGRVISPSQGLYLNTWQQKHRINAYTHRTSMPSVEFEPTIKVSERAKTVHALDRSATVTGSVSVRGVLFLWNLIRADILKAIRFIWFELYLFFSLIKLFSVKKLINALVMAT